MRLVFTSHFTRSYQKAPPAIRHTFDKQSLLLLENLRHPSLHAKKFDEGRDVWQGRVTGGWRFYFRIVDDAYVLEEIRSHPK